MKSKKMFFCIILILLLTFSQLLIVSADVGNSFSGGSSSSGSGGYNSGSSGYSSGGSYSNDYSYSYTPSYNHSYSSGSGSEGDVLLIIVFVVFLGGSFLSWLAKSSGGSQSNNFSTQSANMDIANTGAPSQPQCPEAQIVARIKQSDPNFSESLFKAQAKDVWLTLQEAWEAKDWQSVRNLESEELYKIHSRQLQEYIDMKKTNYMNMQNIHDVAIKDFKTDGTLEIVVVRLLASLLDYVVDDTTGSILEGSKENYVRRAYRLEFIRPKDSKTCAENEKKYNYCPNCGAPVNPDGNGECEYCHTILPGKKYGWALNVYAPWQG